MESNRSVLHLDQTDLSEEFVRLGATEELGDAPEVPWTEFWKFERMNGEVFYLPVHTVVQEG